MLQHAFQHADMAVFLSHGIIVAKVPFISSLAIFLGALKDFKPLKVRKVHERVFLWQCNFFFISFRCVLTQSDESE